jgi:hypothetical protein
VSRSSVRRPALSDTVLRGLDVLESNTTVMEVPVETLDVEGSYLVVYAVISPEEAEDVEEACRWIRKMREYRRFANS